MTDEQAQQLVDENGYLAWRRLEDQSVAVLHDLMFTRSICLGTTQLEMFTTRRFCYEDRDLAVKVFNQLKTKHDIPSGWIASRGLPVPLQSIAQEKPNGS